MARYSSGQAGNTLTLSSAIVSGPPLTLAAWVNVADNGSIQHLFGLSSTSNDNPFYVMRVRFDQPAKNLEVVHRGDTTTPLGTAAASTAFPTGRWVHVAGVFVSSTTRTAYVDGVNVASNTNSIGTTTINQTTVAYSNRNSVAAQWILGSIAHAAIWSVALTATEIAALASGVSPMLIGPSSLAAYWPLRGLACDGPEADAVRRRDLAVVGTSWASDPPIGGPDPLHELHESAWWYAGPASATYVPSSYRRPRWYPGLVRIR